MMTASTKYLIRVGGGSDDHAHPKALVWDSVKPLPLGYPARWLLEKSAQGLRLRDLRGTLGTNYSKGYDDLPVPDVDWARYKKDGLDIHIRSLKPRPIKLSPAAVSELFIELPEQADSFKKIITRINIAFAVCMLAIVLAPGTKKSELKVDESIIPPQFAKILLAPKPKEAPKKGNLAPAGGSMQDDASAGNRVNAKSNKVADTAVVKAFRAKALQSAVQGLLKGGMTALMAAETQLLAGDSRHEAKRIFDGAREGALPTSPDPSAGNGRGVAIAGLGGGGGGAGVGGGLGHGVGYGSGQTAGIVGQGENFVSLDLPNTSVDQGLTKEEVGKVIHAHISEIRYCYESSMLRNSDVEGKLVLDFTIGGSGAVSTASVKESSLNDPRLDDCILRRLTKWSFPKPNGGVDVAVSYPFIFKALKR